MTLQSDGKSLSASILAMLRSGVFFIPMVLLLNQTMGMHGIEMAQPVADVLTVITSIPFIVGFFKKLPKSVWMCDI